jgi:hypothetical protein
VDEIKIHQQSLLGEKFVLVKVVPNGQEVMYSAHESFVEGWQAGQHVATAEDTEGSYALYEVLPSGDSRRRARFAHSRLTLKSVRRGDTMLALAVVE